MSETNKRNIIDQFIFFSFTLEGFSYKVYIVFTRKLINLFGGDYKFFFSYCSLNI